MTRDEQTRNRRFLGSWLELPVVLLVSFVLVFGFVRPVVAQSNYIGSESMVPTLEVWDRVLINKLAYDFGGEPERGDIVLFESVGGGEDPLIKRVVGLPGDTIEVRGGVLFVNGEPRNEPYTNDRSLAQAAYGPTKVPKGHVFCMGDNRGNSKDSRVFGPVPKENIIGKAFVRFWPLDRIGSPE